MFVYGTNIDRIISEPFFNLLAFYSCYNISLWFGNDSIGNLLSLYSQGQYTKYFEKIYFCMSWFTLATLSEDKIFYISISR